MPNDFEKQVKQKMEELTFVPQEPVWTNIEKQIRQKKKRRSAILWLPVMLVLIGSGILLHSRYSMTNHLEKRADIRVTHNQNHEPSRQNESYTETNQNSTVNHSNESEKSSGKKNDNPSKINSEAGRTDKTAAETGSLTTVDRQAKGQKHINIHKQSLNGTANHVALTKKSETINLASIENPPSNIQSRASERHRSSTKLFPSSQSTEKQFSAVQIGNEPLMQNFQGLNSTFLGREIIRTDIAGNTVAAIIKDPLASKGINRKWRKGITVSTGISSMNNGLAITRRAMDFNYIAGPNSSGNTPGSFIAPSNIKNGLSFAVGFALKKQLGKRSFFSTGLQYNYYSTKITVGSNIRRDTLLSSNRAVRDFYLNSAYVTNNVAYVTSTSEYINKYHFVSLPAIIDFQVFRKIPLDLYAGLSYQRLVATNALQYDYAKSIYYKDNTVLNKNQFFSELGINYSFLKNHSLIVGPQFQYSFTSLDGNSNHHLGAVSFKASYLF